MQIDYKNALLNLLSQDANFQTNKKLIQVLGKDVADLISYLLDQYIFHQRNGTLQEDDSFYCSNFDIYLYSGMRMETIIQAKKNGIQQEIFSTFEKGIPKTTYYHLNYKKIFEMSCNPKTIKELAYERALRDGHYLEIEKDSVNVATLEKWTFKDLRLYCKKEKISYTGKDTKGILVEKILKIKAPENIREVQETLVNEITLTSEQENCSLSKNGESSNLVNEITLTSEQKNCSQVSKKVFPNNILNNNILNNHDHEDDFLEIDFEKILKSLGVNFTTTNRNSINNLLQKMKPYEVEKYLRELHQSILNSPGIKNVEALFSTKLKKQECQVIPTSKATIPVFEKKGTPKHYTKADIKNFLLQCNVVEQRRLFDLAKKELQKECGESNAKEILDYIDDDFLGEMSLTQLKRAWIKILFTS